MTDHTHAHTEEDVKTVYNAIAMMFALNGVCPVVALAAMGMLMGAISGRELSREKFEEIIELTKEAYEQERGK